MSTVRTSPTTLPGRWSGICFDLDGLLVDTEPIWMDAKEALFARHGVAFDVGDHHAVFGTSELQAAAYFTRRMGLPESEVPRVRAEYIELVTGMLDTDIVIRPGAREILEYLRGRVGTALVTNTRRPQAELVLRRTGLMGLFDATVTGDEAEPKPAGDLYLLGCQRIGVAPADAVGLEDSPTGVRAVKAAGMYCIAVPSDPHSDVGHADELAMSLLDLIGPR